MGKRSWLTVRDLLIIAAILAAAGIIGVTRLIGGIGDAYPTAVVTVESGEVMRIDLAEDGSRIIELGEPDVRLEVSDHRIRFMDASCPDRLCENMGWLSKSGDMAVCMPYKTVVKLVKHG